MVPRVDRAPAAGARQAGAGGESRRARQARGAAIAIAPGAQQRTNRQHQEAAQPHPDQERYWPAVEAALRQMAWKKTSGDKKGEAKVVDMSTVDVNGLKSAAFPLVMSFNDEQKREMRSLAHLLGLDSVASRF